MAKNKHNVDDFRKFARGIEETIEKLPQGENVEVLVEEKGEVQGSPSTPEASAPTVFYEGHDTVTLSPQEVHALASVGCATLHMGKELPKIEPKTGVDPLLVECYRTLRSLVAGGLINEFDRRMLNDVDVLVAKLKRKVEGGI